MRQAALDLVRDGMSQSEVAERLGVHRVSVSRWCKEESVGRPKPPLAIVWVKGSRRHELPEVMEAWGDRVRSSSAVDVLERHIRSSWEADGTARTG